MKGKKIFLIRKNFIYLFIFSLLYNASLDSAECGILKQVEDVLVSQAEFNDSLQVVDSLQDIMDKDLESIIDILTPTKTISLFYKTFSKMPTKNSATQVEEGNDRVKTSNDLLFNVEGNQVTSRAELETILTSQFSSIDDLDEMHSKMDSIIDLLGSSTQLAIDLDISLSDCEASLGDCCKTLELWDEYLNSIVVSPDDVFWTYIADE